jgi:O-succinylbenzoic acid--CoA ligase
MTPVDPRSLLAAAHDAPDALCLVCPDEGLSLRFAEVADRVARARDALRAQGVCAGDRVTLRASNRASTVVALWALGACGATAVLVHPRLTEEEARYVLDDATPRLHLDDAALHTLWDAPATTTDTDALDPGGPASIAAMVYTSGTSGRPKGAMLSWRALAASAAASAARLGWRDDDAWLLCLPVCHVGGLSVLTRCLAARRPVILLPRFEPGAVLRAVVEQGATLLSVVPTMARALLEADASGALRRLRLMLIGGAATPPSLRAALAAHGVTALPSYGLTEACSQVATPSPGDTAVLGRAGDVGPPLEGVALRVVDGQGRPCAPGETGHIELQGPTLFSGYWGHGPRAEGWWDTGDLGALSAEGRLSVAARRDDLIVSGGENVYPLEVEAALLGCPGVEAVLVFGVDDPQWGHAVAAGLVPRGGRVDDEAGWLGAVMACLRGVLAGFKRPRYVAVVEALPLLSNGKVDRRRALASLGPRLRPWAG